MVKRKSKAGPERKKLYKNLNFYTTKHAYSCEDASVPRCATANVTFRGPQHPPELHKKLRRIVQGETRTFSGS